MFLVSAAQDSLQNRFMSVAIHICFDISSWVALCFSHYVNTLKCMVYNLRTYGYQCDVDQLLQLATADQELFSKLGYNVYQDFTQCRGKSLLQTGHSVEMRVENMCICGCF